jgi:hypothetical protein
VEELVTREPIRGAGAARSALPLDRARRASGPGRAPCRDGSSCSGLGCPEPCCPEPRSAGSSSTAWGPSSLIPESAWAPPLARPRSARAHVSDPSGPTRVRPARAKAAPATRAGRIASSPRPCPRRLRAHGAAAIGSLDPGNWPINRRNPLLSRARSEVPIRARIHPGNCRPNRFRPQTGFAHRQGPGSLEAIARPMRLGLGRPARRLGRVRSSRVGPRSPVRRKDRGARPRRPAGWSGRESRTLPPGPWAVNGPVLARSGRGEHRFHPRTPSACPDTCMSARSSERARRASLDHADPHVVVLDRALVHL